jgi:hypothetical protein
MTRYVLPAALLFVALIVLPACAPADGTATTRSARGAITLEEIQRSNINTHAYDLVASLRPEWLTIRGGMDLRGDSPGIRIYVDNARIGANDTALRNISVRNIRRVDKLTATQATNRFGSGHLQGAIIIESL